MGALVLLFHVLIFDTRAVCFGFKTGCNVTGQQSSFKKKTSPISPIPDKTTLHPFLPFMDNAISHLFIVRLKVHPGTSI